MQCMYGRIVCKVCSLRIVGMYMWFGVQSGVVSHVVVEVVAVLHSRSTLAVLTLSVVRYDKQVCSRSVRHCCCE